MSGQRRYDMRLSRYNRNDSRLTRYNQNGSWFNQLQNMLDQVDASLHAFSGYDWYYGQYGGGYYSDYYDNNYDDYYDDYNDGYCENYFGGYYDAPRPKHKRRKKKNKQEDQPTAVQPAKPIALKGDLTVVGKNRASSKTVDSTNKGANILRCLGNALGKYEMGVMEPLSIGLKTNRKCSGVKIVELLEKDETSPSNSQPNSTQKHGVEKNKVKTELELKKRTQSQKLEPMILDQANTNSGENKSFPKIRNHSPIRSPSPSPGPSPALLKKTKLVFKSNVVVKLLLLHQSETKAVQTKELSEITTDEPPKRTPKDCSNEDQLQKIALDFHQEIELMQLRIEAEASLNGDNNEHSLTVAKVFLTNKQLIAQHTYEFIRSELVGWIGKYQHQQLATPIFHCMANNETHIRIVCENFFAYECLKKCINEIAQMSTLAPSTPSIMRMPHLPKLLYCYDANYFGIIQDPSLFLTQIKLHCSVFKVDRWIVVSHNVCLSKRETHFTFLLDEPSALALTYHYNNKLFICMQKVVFTLRGRMPAEKQEKI